MELPEDLAAVFPPRRSDEPAGLRQDILDELNDHLTCSYHRELLRGTDPDRARARALERFGDPAAVARRLWLDAMKGRIMAKRFVIATCIMVTCASLAVAGVLWLQSARAAQELARALAAAEANRRAAEAALAESNQRMADALARNQTANAEMLKQMDSIVKSSRATATPDWIPVNFKLTQETEHGPPMAGFDVMIGPGTDGYMKEKSIERRTDANGIADFGVVHPGDWSFGIQLKWDDGNREWLASGRFNVLPGSKMVKSIICPKTPPDHLPVRLKVDWPPDLAGQGLSVFTKLKHVGMSYEPSLPWELRVAGDFDPPYRRVLIQSSTKVVGLNTDYLQFWKVDDTSEIFAATLIGRSAAVTAKQTFPTEPGDYRVVQLTVVRGRKVSGKSRFEGEQFEVIATAARKPDNSQEPDLSAASYFKGYGDADGVISTTMPTVPVSDVSWRAIDQQKLDVKPGKASEWTISLPPELITAVREKLKTKPAAMTRP
jgi:hypothetical protein